MYCRDQRLSQHMSQAWFKYLLQSILFFKSAFSGRKRPVKKSRKRQIHARPSSSPSPSFLTILSLFLGCLQAVWINWNQDTFSFFPTNPKSCTEKEEKEKRELHEYCIDVGDPSSLVSGQKKSICGKNDLVSSCKAYQPRTNRLHMMPSLSFTSLPCSLSLSLFLLQALTELLLQAFLSCWLPACCISWLFDMIDGF